MAAGQILVAAALALTVAGCAAGEDGTPQPAADPPLAHVGSATCAECHAEEARAWRDSDHDLAMQEATPRTVLGDFDGASFTYAGVTSTFSRDGDRFLVETDGASGALETFEVTWTFGFEPLQQYLVLMPDGRVQALDICWDTRPAEEGGQRWFHLYPDEAIDHEDPLHWTGIYQNWNFMCAECHSTELRRHYDPSSDTFDTTWKEIDVACEACHGQGSRHVAWARGWEERERRDRPPGLGLPVDFEAGDGTWAFGADGIARRTAPRTSDTELQTCARCHARRAPLVEEEPRGLDLLQTHRPALLDDDLFFPDGQIRDEVYVYGSFLQSRMHAAGVTCGDCHDPHTLELRAGGGPDSACARCHDPTVFAAPAHHHHGTESTGASCVACHMPARTYMVVDPRRDHSFRVPRPDLRLSLGTPDPCSDCHRDHSAEWAAERFAEWYPGPQPVSWGPAFARARAGDPAAADALVDLLADPGRPAIVRATAAKELGAFPDGRVLRALENALRHAEPLVRLGGLTGSERLLGFGGPDLARSMASALDDPVRAVRIDAGRILSGVPPNALPPAQLASLEAAVEELRATRLTYADRPEALAQLATLATRRGEPDLAEDYYLRALEIAPSSRLALVNLADLYRQLGRDLEGEALLRRGIGIYPEDADLRHGLGLNLIRQEQDTEALRHLRRAWEIGRSTRHGYVYAVALQDAGRTGEAVEVLESLRGRGDPQVLEALVAFYRSLGDLTNAAAAARDLARLRASGP